MRLPILSISVVVAVAVGALPSAACAQAGFGSAGSEGVAKPPQIETSAAAKTRLYVKTLPPGAQVTLDGKPLGVSDGLFLVPAGTGKVSVQFDGAAPQVRQVEIAEGRITRVEVSLEGDQPAAGGRIAPPQAGQQDPVNAGFGPPPPPRRLTSNRPPVPSVPLSPLDAKLLAVVEDVNFDETPLRDAVPLLAKSAGVEMIIDTKALEDAGVDLNTPITERLQGLPLIAVLDNLLGPYDLTWLVREGIVEVTTGERASEKMIVHMHDVSDLTGTEGLAGLAELIQNAIEPESWGATGGPGSIRPITAARGTSFAVSQTWRNQWQIARFLEVLRQAKATPPDKRRPLGSNCYWGGAASAVAARAALEKAVDVEFKEMPLRDALFALAEEVGVPIGLDVRSLEAAGVDADVPVTFFTLTVQPLAVMLDRLLAQIDMTFVISGGRLVATTQEAAEQMLSVAFYPFGPGNDREGRADWQGLIDAIQATVTPQDWESHGGPATIQVIDGDVPGLVIRHTTAGHRAVDAFLRALPEGATFNGPAGQQDPVEQPAGGGFCWVAREVYGVDDPRWRGFRDWLAGEAPAWLHDLYGARGEAFAAWIRNKPAVKGVLRVLMDRVVDGKRDGHHGE